jgi:hypothetical protein
VTALDGAISGILQTTQCQGLFYQKKGSSFGLSISHEHTNITISKMLEYCNQTYFLSLNEDIEKNIIFTITPANAKGASTGDIVG